MDEVMEVQLRNREDIHQEEGFIKGEDSTDSVEEMEVNSDLSDEGHERSSNGEGGWGSLPEVCLRQVFRCLCDHDRVSANLVCRHWYQVMHSPSLWRSHIFYFSGRKNRSGMSEHSCALAYACSLGVYLEGLEVFVHPPRRSTSARRLERAICALFYELVRVKAPVRTLCITRLELDRPAWSSGLRNSLVNCLIHFLVRGSAKLTSVSLNCMRNSMNHGVELLRALLHSQRHQYPERYIATLDLRGFFSGSLRVHLNSSFPDAVRHQHGLTSLGLSYSYLSDELLTALQHRHQGELQHSDGGGNTLQTLSLYCAFNEPHRQIVSGDSWATLASNCPDLKVKLIVDQVTNTNWLARILLPDMPLAEYCMTALYSPNEEWSAKPVLSHMLPRFRRTLQFLFLDLISYRESLDEELLMLVEACECLKELRVWAFLEVSTLRRLLHIRLTQRRLLNKIRVRIYSDNDSIPQLEQLEELWPSHVQIPTELDFFAVVYPFVS